MSGEATHAVILNGVSPAGEGGGAKRSDGSLTERWAEAVGVSVRRFTRRLRPLQSEVLRLRFARFSACAALMMTGLERGAA